MELIKKDEIKRILDKYNINVTIEEIEKRYSESHRYYHIIEHINFMINGIYDLFDKKSISNNDKDILLVAALFHDIIYEIGKNDNEQKSAEFLNNNTDFVDEFQSNDINKSFDIIMDTIDHKPNNELSKLLCDLDMYTISDSSFIELLKYEKQIYLEFQKYPFNVYKKGRLQFLRNMLNNEYGKKNYDNIIKLIEYIENYKPKIGLYAGSFNPLHIGHKNIMKKSESLFDKIVIAIGINPEKNDDVEYVKSLKENSNSIDKNLNVEVRFYTGLLTDFIKEKQSSDNVDITLIRGLRDGFDLVYENNQIQYMKDMYPELKVVYIPGDREFDHISSSSLRYLKTYDEKLIEKYLP